MFYKMFEHEPMNNPALGEAGLVRSVRVKKENSILLFCKSVTVAFYLVPSAPGEIGNFNRS